MNLSTQRILVTGATGGIGREIARQLGAEGAALLLTGRSPVALARLGDELRDSGVRVATVAADLATADGRQAVVTAAMRFRRGISGLINNAGINRFGSFAEMSGDAIRSVFEINVLAPILLTHDLLPVLKRSPESVVLNVGSIVGSIGMPGQVAYSSSKFAIHGFSEALRRETQGSGVHVLHVAPRATDTAMNDETMRAINAVTGVNTDRPAEVARHVVAALVAHRQERYLGWPEKFYVRVNALLPGLVDRSLKKQADLVGQSTAAGAGLTTMNGVKP